MYSNYSSFMETILFPSSPPSCYNMSDQSNPKFQSNRKRPHSNNFPGAHQVLHQRQKICVDEDDDDEVKLVAIVENIPQSFQPQILEVRGTSIDEKDNDDDECVIKFVTTSRTNSIIKRNSQENDQVFLPCHKNEVPQHSNSVANKELNSTAKSISLAKSTVAYHGSRHCRKFRVVTLKCLLPDCPLMFQTNDLLRRHMSCEHDQLAYPCLLSGCNLSFDKEEFRYKHYENAHLWTELKCTLCEDDQKVFQSYSRLIYHHLFNHNEGCFSCTKVDCSFTSNLRKDVSAHYTRTHERFACQYCMKEFSYKHVLLRHERGHLGIKPYRCKVCHFDSNDQSIVVKHIRSRHFKVPRSKKAQLEKNIVESQNPNEYLEVLSIDESNLAGTNDSHFLNAFEEPCLFISLNVSPGAENTFQIVPNNSTNTVYSLSQ